MRRILIHSLFVTVALATVASAQGSTDDRVRELNQRAMTAYGELSFDTARASLEEALSLCRSSSCAPSGLGKTYLNLGVVVMGETSDAARVQQLFEHALQADPSAALDPTVSTPELAQIFARARGAAPAATTGATAENELGLAHAPVEEQLVHTAIPVYVGIPDTVNVSRMVLRFRANGSREFTEMPMRAMVEGFGAEIPCDGAREPSLAYYVVALASGSRVLGTVGSEARPFTVRIVRTRRLPPPSLPGRAPPETCTTTSSETECPPGRPNCHGDVRNAQGGSCTTDSGCESGLSCSDGTCASPESSSRAAWGETRRFFVEVGPALTVGTAHGGMTAASTPEVDPGQPDPQKDTIASNDSFYVAGANGCDAASGYCVRVTRAGTAFAWGVEINAGVWLSRRLGIAVHTRVAPQAGSGTLSHVLVGGRLLLRLVVPRPDGFHLSLFVGGSAGQIQVRPKQQPTPPSTSIDRPWARTGIGGAELGATLGYFFTPAFGVYVTPSLYALLPETSFGAQLALGLSLQFGAVGREQSGPSVVVADVPIPDDRDHDRIADSRDQCPTDAEDRDTYQDEDGCPDLDDDSDGVPDDSDRCPREAEDRDGFQDEDGCPDADNDGDGVADAADRCPVEAGVPANQGCPDPDRDSDGTPDRVDNCPDEVGPSENHGCARQQLVVIQNGRLEILEKVYFRTNSHVIDRRSNALLDNVAAVIRAHPEIGAVRIEGHTDARGDAAKNRALSQRRARSVMQYLVRKGHVPASRLTAQGFGPDQPIHPNATSDEEHEANRRVEFRLQ